MAVFGTLAPTRDGGWEGAVFLLGHHVKVKLVPNDNRKSDGAPDFRIFAGLAELGAAWRKASIGDHPRDFLSVELDGPGLTEPISAAVFFSEDGKKAQLVWNRRREPPMH